MKPWHVLSGTLFLAGVGSAVYGFWLLYHPLGWILGGLVAALEALLIDREASRESR